MHSWQTPNVETLFPMHFWQLAASALGPIPVGHMEQTMPFFPTVWPGQSWQLTEKFA